jgi:hypothetical protein
MSQIRKINRIPYTLLDSNGNKQYAVTTLLMISDNYLPGCISLAFSIEKANMKLRKEIDLICMVTEEISEECIKDLEQYFDRVIRVPYIEVDVKTINHSKDKVKNIYAKAFTKVNALQFTEYKKVFQVDVDMLVIKDDFFNIFSMKAPASPFVGCLVFYKPEVLKYYKKIYKDLKHGHLVPKHLYDIDCKKLYAKYKIEKMAYLGVESTVFLFEPNMKDYENLKRIVSRNDSQYKSEANLFAEYYKYKLHHIDMNYVGRWESPVNNPKLVMIDMYGTDGKPWQLDKIDFLFQYEDAKYWMMKFLEYYRRSFKKTCKVKEIHEIAKYLEKKFL